MIGECVILRGIEDFEQCRRRVAAKIRTELVNLVQKNHGIATLDAAKRLNNPSGIAPT